MSDCVAFPPTRTEVSHKQQNICGPGAVALTKRLYRLFSFNRQNVWHSGLSWPFSGLVISKCVLSRALLLHTIEKRLGWGGVAAASQDYGGDSFAAEVEQTKINTNILHLWLEWKSGVDGGGRRVMPQTSDCAFLCPWKGIPSNVKAAFSQT